jgi:tRNA threonylcarbamoyladenosine modification (KEOPS) complex Cgi121 subunit
LVSFKIGKKYVYFHTVFLKEPHNSSIINHFRNEFPDIFIQGLNFDIVYSYEHLLEILKISTLAERRDTMCSNKIELDFLLRIVGTNQISQAIKDGGLKFDNYIVFVILACKMQIDKIKQKIIVLFGNSEEEIFLDKKILSRKIEKYKIRFNNNFLEEKNIIKFLKESGALITI